MASSEMFSATDTSAHALCVSVGKPPLRTNFSVDSNIPQPISEQMKRHPKAKSSRDTNDFQIPSLEIDLANEIDVDVGELPPVESPHPIVSGRVVRFSVIEGVHLSSGLLCITLPDAVFVTY